MRYVRNGDQVFAMSNTNYRRMLRAIMDEMDFNLDQLGKLVVPYVTCDITDVSMAEIKELYKAERGTK